MIGSNVPTVGGLQVGFRYADDWGCECIQVYLTPSRTWKVGELATSKISEFKKAWKNSKVRAVVSHVPFLANIASKNIEIREKAISRLIIEIERANKFEVQSLVLHPGSNPDNKKGLELIIKGLNHVFDIVDADSSKFKILLETMTGQWNSIGEQFEQLNYIIENIEKSENIGICFDTCHVFAAGYDIRGYKGYENILREFEKVIGLDKIQVIHLNDSKYELGSKKDRHCAIGEGLIGIQTFHAIVRDKRFDEIPKILEIPERDTKSKENLELLRNLRTQNDPITEKRKIRKH
ncbi:MAG: deoxyribonuclease IV [Candidatus Hermodarchaeota archaeon]